MFKSLIAPRATATLWLLTCALLAPLAAVAADYPNRAIRLVVPFAPGGAADGFARSISQPLAARLGQPVVVENRAGAGGTVAADHVARAAADGYTLLIADIGPNAVAAGLFPQLSYDAARDFAPITLGTRVPMILMVHPGVPARDLRELIADIRQHPGRYNFGSAGSGGISHLTGEMLRIRAGLDMVHVPYKGGGNALAGILGGDVQMMFATASTGLGPVRSGKARAYAVAAAQRTPLLPDVPTMKEQGVDDFVALSWSGVMAPAGTPAAIVERLATEIRAVLASPEVNAQLVQRGFEVVGSSPQEFAAFLQDEIRQWTQVIRAANVKPD